MTFDVITAARRRTRRQFTVAVLIGIVVIAVLIYPAGLYVNAFPDDPPAPAIASAAGPSRASTAPPGGVLGADVTWIRLAGVDLPVSASAGPADSVGGLARGFAHSRAGAVIAAVHLLVRTTAQVGPATFEPTLDKQVVGEHAQAMRRVVPDEYAQAAKRSGVGYGAPLAELPATVVGVRVDTYTDARAVLSVLTSAADAEGLIRYAATTVTLAWVDGDWRLVAPPDGRWDSQVRLVDGDQVGRYPSLRGR
jgi:hypothetical protein